MPSTLKDRLDHVQGEIAQASRDHSHAVRLVVVTKSAPRQIFSELAQLGVTDLGENRVQGASERLAGFEDRFRWHFIGHLQSNKARAAVALFDVFHGVDSLALLQRLDRVAGELGRQPELLLQVNVSGETSKSGLAPDALNDVLAASTQLQHARVTGLMTMAPRNPEVETTRPIFRQLAQLAALKRQKAPALTELSMGMTEDFVVAIEEGATVVRIGRKIVSSDSLS
ncbi:MAG: pyridoxal phosphate enzyme (YggS family) [Pseudohongiellaceae bacterium]